MEFMIRERFDLLEPTVNYPQPKRDRLPVFRFWAL